MLENPKESPLLARQGPARAGPRREFGPTFGFFGHCKRIRDTEVLLILLSLKTYAAPGLFNEIEHDYYSDFVKNFNNSVEVTISCRMPKSKTNLPIQSQLANRSEG